MEESNMKVMKSTSSRASTRVQYCGTGPECSKHTTSFILKELITTRTNKKDSCQHLATSTIKLTNHSLHHQRGWTTSAPIVSGTKWTQNSVCRGRAAKNPTSLVGAEPEPSLHITSISDFLSVCFLSFLPRDSLKRLTG